MTFLCLAGEVKVAAISRPQAQISRPTVCGSGRDRCRLALRHLVATDALVASAFTHLGVEIADDPVLRAYLSSASVKESGGIVEPCSRSETQDAMLKRRSWTVFVLPS